MKKIIKISIFLIITLLALLGQTHIYAKYVINEVIPAIELNFDRTAPNITVNYSNRELTNENITVTIVSDEEILEVEGWNISEDRKTLTKDFEENTTENIKVYDLAGNCTNIEVEITNIDKTPPKITVDKVKNQDGSITVKISADEEIIILDDTWQKNEDGSYEKTYVDNITENIVVKDKVGNETEVNIIVEEINKEPANIKVSYNNLKTNLKEVILISDKAIDLPEGWYRKSDTEIYKLFTSNTSFKQEVIDCYDNTVTVNVKVTGIKQPTHTHSKNCYVGHNHTAYGCDYHSHTSSCYHSHGSSCYTTKEIDCTHTIGTLRDYDIQEFGDCPTCGFIRTYYKREYGYTCQGTSTVTRRAWFYESSNKSCSDCNKVSYYAGQSTGSITHQRTGSVLTCTISTTTVRCNKTVGYQCSYTSEDTNSKCNQIVTRISPINDNQKIYKNELDLFKPLCLVEFLDGHVEVKELNNNYDVDAFNNNEQVITYEYTGLYGNAKTNKTVTTEQNLILVD